MDQEQKEIVIAALVDFVKRASQFGATPEEVAVLPEVAKVLLDWPITIQM